MFAFIIKYYRKCVRFECDKSVKYHIQSTIPPILHIKSKNMFGFN